MAGNLEGMGLGRLGGNDIVFKRKYRWTFEVKDICGGGKVPAHVVKLAARPNITIEETEINFLHAKTWIPGKGTWETISVTYYDIGGPGAAEMINLWTWLNSVYMFQNSTKLFQASRRGGPLGRGYAATGLLSLYDGCGIEMERWVLGDLWPQAINFGELDYSSSEEVTLELTLRYSEVDYKRFCPNIPIPECCTGCNA